jgi:hypothetical protein
MRAVANTVEGMCLGAVVGLIWPLSIPTNIFLYLKKDKNEDEKEKDKTNKH